MAEEQYSALRAMAEGVFHARELTNLSGSDGYPAAFAEYVREILEPLGVTVTIFGSGEILEAGMGSLYGVSQGSQHKAHLVIAHWEGNDDDQPVALVGKGNTFDTGGYNLKTNAASILQMQTDKAGAIFLQHFAADTPWLHLDIAGNAFFESANGVTPPGATGYGVRLLSEWVKIHGGQ